MKYAQAKRFGSYALLMVCFTWAACGKSNDTGNGNPPPPAEKGWFRDTISFKPTGTFVTCVAVQKDGKIVIANRTQIGRINADGTQDPGFTTYTLTSGEIKTIFLDKNGKLLVGGTFTSFGGQPYPYLVRLTGTGQIDNSFQAFPESGVTLLNKGIYTIVQQSTGKLVVGGAFLISINNQAAYFDDWRKPILRISASIC